MKKLLTLCAISAMAAGLYGAAAAVPYINHRANTLRSIQYSKLSEHEKTTLSKAVHSARNYGDELLALQKAVDLQWVYDYAHGDSRRRAKILAAETQLESSLAAQSK